MATYHIPLYIYQLVTRASSNCKLPPSCESFISMFLLTITEQMIASPEDGPTGMALSLVLMLVLVLAGGSTTTQKPQKPNDVIKVRVVTVPPTA